VDFAAMASLKAQGIVGIVNLCEENNDDEEIALKLGMKPHHIPILDNSPPTRSQIDDFIKLATTVTPCYVHREAGIGRHGTSVPRGFGTPAAPGGGTGRCRWAPGALHRSRSVGVAGACRPLSRRA